MRTRDDATGSQLNVAARLTVRIRRFTPSVTECPPYRDGGSRLVFVSSHPGHPARFPRECESQPRQRELCDRLVVRCDTGCVSPADWTHPRVGRVMVPSPQWSSEIGGRVTDPSGWRQPGHRGNGRVRVAVSARHGPVTMWLEVRRLLGAVLATGLAPRDLSTEPNGGFGRTLTTDSPRPLVARIRMLRCNGR
jgi:hypothetical protein